MTEPSFTCSHCGARSFNPNDLVHRYCGACHHFCDDVAPVIHPSLTVKGPFGQCSHLDCGAPASVVLLGQVKVCDRHDPFSTPR